ncbi:MAG TPA: DUF2243 domain-containing protein [Tepidisphaeraceae bacterium]|jgi:uncharacterized membrane protein|nr:DUF2243 domain-containing protein [Tepidisphaeraceae bacterium]
MFWHPFVIGGILLGMGLGAFVDGIVLHQILQWHHLVCITDHCTPLSIEHLQRQNRQDGYFHLGALVLTIVGSYRVFRTAQLPDVPRSPLAFVGATLCGWGAFNLIEGLINHQFLQIHHVLPGRPYEFAADMAFLASGVLLIVIGYLLLRRAFRHRDITR